jgi:hypothetical protein
MNRMRIMERVKVYFDLKNWNNYQIESKLDLFLEEKKISFNNFDLNLIYVFSDSLLY